MPTVLMHCFPQCLLIPTSLQPVTKLEHSCIERRRRTRCARFLAKPQEVAVPGLARKHRTEAERAWAVTDTSRPEGRVRESHKGKGPSAFLYLDLKKLEDYTLQCSGVMGLLLAALKNYS